MLASHVEFGYTAPIAATDDRSRYIQVIMDNSKDSMRAVCMVVSTDGATNFIQDLNSHLRG